MTKPRTINNVVVISDTHCGCRLGLCPPEGVNLDDGGMYIPSTFQRKVWEYWRFFWDEHVPSVVRNEPFDVVHCGDALDGVPHQGKTPVSHNWVDQQTIGTACLLPIVEAAKASGGTYFHVRGTEAHVGKSGEREELLARTIGAKRNKYHQHARWDVWKRCGPKLLHILHHIGATGSQAYEATAVHKELMESFVEASRWGDQPPDMIIRGHRHRYILTEIATSRGGQTAQANALVLPGWQGKTPFTWKIPGGRLAPPQFGGAVVRYSEESGELYVRPQVWTVKRSEPE